MSNQNDTTATDQDTRDRDAAIIVGRANRFAPNEKEGANQAAAQVASIRQMVRDLETADTAEDDDAREQAREAIEQDALELQVRTDWHNPGQPGEAKPTEFFLLLCTGGPACRVIGELDENCQPENVRVEFQDWGTPWINYPLTSGEAAAVLEYAGVFYFGE